MQKFVGYVHNVPTDEARGILTDTDNASIRERREQLIISFMEDKLSGRLAGYYEKNTEALGKGMNKVEGYSLYQYENVYQSAINNITTHFKVDIINKNVQSINNFENTYTEYRVKKTTEN